MTTEREFRRGSVTADSEGTGKSVEDLSRAKKLPDDRIVNQPRRTDPRGDRQQGARHRRLDWKQRIPINQLNVIHADGRFEREYLPCSLDQNQRASFPSGRSEERRVGK